MSDGFAVTVEDGGVSAMLGRASREIIDEAHKVVTRGAVNIKESMREDAEASVHFRDRKSVV